MRASRDKVGVRISGPGCWESLKGEQKESERSGLHFVLISPRASACVIVGRAQLGLGSRGGHRHPSDKKR